jgi:DNA repair exonuclease SbcCD ATPase subunit
MSQGYDNFIDTNDYEIRKRVSDWLTGLDIDIKRYIHAQSLNEEIKEYEEAQKELKKLNKEKSKIESKIAKKDIERRTFEAKRTIPDQNNMNSIDPNILEKEQKKANDLEEDRNKLDYELKEIKQKIEAAEKHVAEHDKAIKEIKSAKP